MTTIGNIGLGLLILIVLWISALGVFVYSVRAQSNIGWIFLTTVTFITIILVIIPTESTEKPEFTNLEKDYKTLYKQILLFFLSTSALLACVFFFILHCIEPIRANRVKSF